MDAPTLAAQLWPHGSGPDSPQAYAVLDGARDPRIVPQIRAGGLPYACLYEGVRSQDLLAAAPYLVQIAPESTFFRTLVAQGWGRAWGVFAIAPDVTLKALRRHWRTLLRVSDAQGRVLAFRCHDPRVLRLYLPSCTAPEARRFIGPMQAVAFESETGDALIQLRQQPGFAQGGMLIIRDEQMAVFRAAAQRRMRERLFFRLGTQPMRIGLAQLGPQIDIGLSEAARLQIHGESDIALFLEIVFTTLGPFALDGQGRGAYPAAAARLIGAPSVPAAHRVRRFADWFAQQGNVHEP